MPLSNGFFGIDFKLLVAGVRLDLNPGGFRTEHQMGVFRRHRQRRVDGRGERMDQLRPFRAEQPERTAAHLAEMPLGRAAAGATVALILEPRVIDRDLLAAADLQAVGVTPRLIA